MTQQDIQRMVLEYIVQEYLPGAKISDLSERTPLITGGILNSLGTMNLIIFLEDRFGIQVKPNEISVQYLNTTHDIARLVQSKLVA